MTCPHCGSTDWYELVDGRSRCEVCFATYEAKREETERPTGIAQASETRSTTATAQAAANGEGDE